MRSRSAGAGVAARSSLPARRPRTDRAIPQMNVQPTAATVINGTRFPPPINAGGGQPGDPFTPMLRSYAGEKIRGKSQAGGPGEGHNASSNWE